MNSRNEFFPLLPRIGKVIPAAFFAATFLLFINGCGESKKDLESTTIEIDSIENFDAPVSTNDVGKDSTRQIDPAAVASSLQDKSEAYIEAIFADDWSRTSIGWEDEFPKFPDASESMYFKLLSDKPVQGQRGKVIPRSVFKAFRFSNEETTIKAANVWLQGEESSEDELKLGIAAEAFKSPPFMCAVTENEIYMMKSACVYTGAQWENLKELFRQEFSGSHILYRFEVGCKAGNMSYEIIEGKQHEN